LIDISQYTKEDESITFHENDSVLDQITIKLPSLTEFYSKHLGREVSWEEAITYVDGYGLAPDDQVFRHQVMPEKLKTIYQRVFDKLKVKHKAQYKDISDVSLDDVHSEISNNRIDYVHEIAWIKLQIKRRYYGYWFFCNGKPTYLNGANYFFLNFWKVKNEGRNNNLPDYRDYQRGMFHLLMYAYTTTEAFYKHAIVFNEDGQKKIEYRNSDIAGITQEFKERGVDFYVRLNVNVTIDKGIRTVNGVNFISGRRIAKTAIACCFCYWGTTNSPEQTFVIQAMNKDQADLKIFVKQIQIPFLSLPFFFTPFSRGRDEKKSGLDFMYEGNMLAAHKAGVVPDPLNCFVTPMASTEKAADGEEVHFVYRDEPAKKPDEKSPEQNIPTWWYNTMKPATERGEEIIGFCIMPSTVGNMDTGGGSQFLEIVNGSHFGKRDDNGTTPSGLINFLLPGYYAIPGNFIDKFGRTVIDDPKEPVMGNRGKPIVKGAKTYLNNKLEYFQRNNMWKEYTQWLQNYPPDFVSAFSVTPEGMDFPVEKMRKRISETKFANPPLIGKIDLVWSGERFKSEVLTDIQGIGMWSYTYLPPRDKWNRKMVVTMEDGYIAPRGGGPIFAPDPSVANKFFLCFDPIKFNERNRSNNKSSTPAAAVFYRQDSLIDPDNKPRGEWVSNDYICKIKIKTPDKDTIYEEILKMAILLGAYIYPERNDADDFLEWIRDKGYDGYLLKDSDENGKLEKVPGVWADKQTKNDMAVKMAYYFNANVRYMKDWEIIEEWLQMRSLEDLTNHDLAAASGWCQRAAAQRTGEYFEELHRPVVIEAGFTTYNVDY